MKPNVIKGAQMVEYLLKTFPFQYLNFSRKRKAFFSTLKLNHLLKHKKEYPRTDEPFFILNFLAASELGLKTHSMTPEKDSSEQYKEYCQMQEYQATHKLKLINFDDFDEILIDFDRYVKNVIKRSFSTVYSYMKANKLSSLVHSKPAEESVFRFMDIRVRVYIYELMNKFVDTFKSSDSFFKKLKSAGVDGSAPVQELTIDLQNQKMQRYMSKNQRCIQLAMMDIELKNTWSNYQITTPEQSSHISGWLNSIRMAKASKSVHRKYNTALFNRLISLENIYGGHIIENNRILNELSRHAYWDSQGSSDLLLTKASDFDAYTKELIHRKASMICEEWQTEYMRSQAKDAAQAARQHDRMLLSLKMTIKYSQMIMVVSEYCSAVSRCPGSMLNAGPETGDVQLLDNLSSPLVVNKSDGDKKMSDLALLSKEKQKFMQYFMTKLLRNHVLRVEKFKELDAVLTQFKEISKKDQDITVKNTEFDHIIAQNMHFCQMAATMASQKETSKLKHTGAELIVQKDMIQSYLDIAANSSFLSANKYMLETNLAGLFSEVFKYMLKEQTEVFKDSSILIAKKKPQKRKARPEAKLKDNLCSNIMANNGRMLYNPESNLLPFVVNFLVGFIGKSYNISTNNEEECYVISREEFLELMAVMLKESSTYTQKVFGVFREHYITNYIHALYSRAVSASTLEFLKRNFILLLKDFHKLIESKMAEQNLNMIYELDKLAKFIKYSLYDSTLIFDKLIESNTTKYQDASNQVELEARDLTSRSKHFSRHLSLTVKEFSRSNHNLNMHSLQ